MIASAGFWSGACAKFKRLRMPTSVFRLLNLQMPLQ